jgi:hypothetical protein
MVTGKILSTGGPLQIGKDGLKFIGNLNYEGNSAVVDGHFYTPCPEYWEMIKQNREAADATAHIQVKAGKLYHDGKMINFGDLTVKWMDHAVFWLDWVVGPGNTSKSGQPSLYNIEPQELLYYNFRTLRGGSVFVGGKGSSGEVQILTDVP